MQLIVRVHRLLFKEESKYLITDYPFSKPLEEFLHVSRQLYFTQLSVLLSPKGIKWIKNVSSKICV